MSTAGSALSSDPKSSSTLDISSRSPTLREIDPCVDQKTVCKLCFKPACADGSLGPLYEYEVDRESEIYCAHYFCLLFSSGLDQNGDDDEQIKGFLTADVLREWRRGQRLKCATCDARYATVGCGHKACRKTFHLPCALESGALPQFCDNFAVFCREHRPTQGHGLISEGFKATCGVCLDDIYPRVDNENLSKVWAPCCGGWFHRECLQHLAKSTGYFFKCALCNNKDLFEREMKLFGVYIPEQDASWETDAQAFGGLLERHNTCDALDCLCPRGRKEDVDDTPWEILLCYTCGSRGIHIECAHLEVLPTTRWNCESCTKVRSRLPPTYKNHYRRVKRGRMVEETAAALPARLTFKLTSDNCIKIQHKGMEILKEMSRPLPKLSLQEEQKGHEREVEDKNGQKTVEETVIVDEEVDEEVSFRKKAKKRKKCDQKSPLLPKVKPSTTPESVGTKQTSILNFFKKSS